MWYAACSDVSGAGIGNTKAAIVGKGDGATFAKKRSICPGAGDNNKGIRRWRHPHLSQTQNRFKQSRVRIYRYQIMKQPMKGHGKSREGWRGFQSSSCRRNEEEKKGAKRGSREVATGSWQDSPSPVRPVGRHRWDGVTGH